MKTRFISIEGGEGTGKTTLGLAIQKKLQQKQINCLLTREPGGSPIAEDIRVIFKTKYPDENFEPLSELFLIAAARHQHITYTIVPAIKSQTWVICDRFTDTTRVYQGPQIAQADVFNTIINCASDGLEPDWTILLDCPVETIKKRLINRQQEQQQAERYDDAGIEKLQQIRQGFLDLARHNHRISVFDATQSPQELADSVYNEMEQRFGII